MFVSPSRTSPNKRRPCWAEENDDEEFLAWRQLPFCAQLERELSAEHSAYHSLAAAIPELPFLAPDAFAPSAALVHIEHVLMTRPASAAAHREELRLACKRLAVLVRDKENN